MDKVNILKVIGVGKVDGANVPENAIDGKKETRVSMKGIGSYLEFDLDSSKPFNSLLLAMYKGAERSNSLKFGFSTDGGQTYKNVTFNTTGKTDGPELIKFPIEIKGANKARLYFNGNTNKDEWFSVLGIEFINYNDGQNLPAPKPNPPTPPVVNPPPTPTTGRTVKKVNYPPSKTTDKSVKSIKYDAEIAKKNYANAHLTLLPLVEQVDKYGEHYTDIPKLLQSLGYNIGIKDYDFENEKFDPYENNNSGGESKRFDMKGVHFPQNEYQIKLNNKSGDMGDETSKKEFGPHSDDIANQADCFIIQIANDGKSAVTQLEPGHMLPDPHGYGDKFNKVSLKGIPALAGNTYAVRFIRVIDLDQRRVIGLVAIKFFTGDGPKDWTLIYETVVYDGMGGNRGLKDPFQAWAFVNKVGNTVGSTVRMDSQPSTKIKKGEDYDLARITSILDYE